MAQPLPPAAGHAPAEFLPRHPAEGRRRAYDTLLVSEQGGQAGRRFVDTTHASTVTRQTAERTNRPDLVEKYPRTARPVDN
jgi:hypothetical protein